MSAAHFDHTEARNTLRERGITDCDHFLAKSLLTATEAAIVLGVKNARTARDTLNRWGIESVGRGSGRTGESLYPADLVWGGQLSPLRRGRTKNPNHTLEIPLTAVLEAPTTWYADHSTLVGFAHILTAADWLTTTTDVIDYFDKPWKWGEQHAQWAAAGRPEPDTDGWQLLLDSPFGEQ
ncbi:hypothetical protein [Nocardia salmonicida]|uniref:hypothetical protein n=1 Tax=Nocardia salmonicida TaxID=53431 RepID=UPI0012F4E09B|nr:hypothetical protein [Nocardia salmonicida]MBC7299461.1 hypothetical protein [Nocardia sp.]